MKRSGSVCVVQHVEYEPPGTLSSVLEASGHAVHHVHVDRGDEVLRVLSDDCAALGRVFFSRWLPSTEPMDR